MSGLPTSNSPAGTPPRIHLSSNSWAWRLASTPYSRSPRRLASTRSGVNMTSGASMKRAKNATAAERVPVPRERESHTRAVWRSVPRRPMQRDLLAPHPVADGVDQDDEADLQRDRVAQPQRRGDRRVEGRDLLRNHDTAIDELFHHRADPLMDHDLGEDQDGKRDEK